MMMIIISADFAYSKLGIRDWAEDEEDELGFGFRKSDR